ncbi:MAG: YicC family protein, partial [Lachnoclostridium sp.]|nr:YicC family protein [Lachnoclostridium sp.]
MIRSMTGYGNHEVITDEYRVTVEIKSVNHRYCDIAVKLPRKLSFYENDIRSSVKNYASRGKIDVFVSYEVFQGMETRVVYHKDIASDYVHKIEEISEDFSLDKTWDAYHIACLPEVLTIEDTTPDQEKLKTLILESLGKAGQQLILNREAEGRHLKVDLLIKLDSLLTLLTQIESRAPEILEAHRQKIMAKVMELLGDRNIDDSVLISELVIFAEKICVDEETVRLRSHVENMKNTLEQGEKVGRKLDFIAQEMNRESNTILSKSNDLEVSNYAI